MHVEPRRYLLAADRATTPLAQLTVPTRYDSGDDDGFILPLKCIASGKNNSPADLMAQRQGKRVPGADAVKIEAKIRMTDATSGDFDHDLIRLRLFQLEIDPGQRFSGLFDDPALRAH